MRIWIPGSCKRASAFQHGSQVARVAMLFCAVAIHSAAEPSVGMDSSVVAPGQKTNVALRLTGAAASYGGFNASLHLPRGVSVHDVQPGSLLPPDCTFHVQRFVSGQNNGVAVAAFTATAPFNTDGVLCTLNLVVGPDVAPGTYPLAFGGSGRPPFVNDLHALGSAAGDQSVAHTGITGFLTVRHTVSPGDSNGNGIPDTWEIQWFGSVTNVTHSTDADGDGLSDYYEFLSGTDPRDETSCIAIRTAEVRDSAFVLEWYAAAGAVYTVRRSDDLLRADGFSPVIRDLVATPPLNVYTDAPPGSSPACFYQIERQP